MDFRQIGAEMGDVVSNLIDVHSPHHVTVNKIDKDTIEVGVSFDTSDTWQGEPFDVNFAFKVSSNHKTLTLVDAPVVTNSDIELFGQDIINNYMRNLRGSKKIERIDLSDAGDDSVLNITLK